MRLDIKKSIKNQWSRYHAVQVLESKRRESMLAHLSLQYSTNMVLRFTRTT